MRRSEVCGGLLAVLVASTLVVQFAHAQSSRQSSAYREPLYRKFVSKPNGAKKQSLYYQQQDLHNIEKSDYSYNSVLSNPSSAGLPAGADSNFNWSRLLNVGLQFITGAAQAFTNGAQIEKTDSGEGFSWAKAISIGMQVLLNVLGGGNSITEKNDDPTRSAMQGVLATVLGLAMGQEDPGSVQVMAKQATELFSVIMNLMGALRTSFSERSLHARSLGSTDYLSDAGFTAITMLEGVGRNYLAADDDCSRKSLCISSQECVQRTSDGGLICQLGGYAAAYMSPRSLPLSDFTEATRHGRIGHDCAAIYSACNLL